MTPRAFRDHRFLLGDEFLDRAVGADAAPERGDRRDVVGFLPLRFGLIDDLDLVLHVRDVRVGGLEVGAGDGKFGDIPDGLAAEGDLAAAEPDMAEVVQGGQAQHIVVAGQGGLERFFRPD